MPIDEEDLADLREAVFVLENPSFIATVANLVGRPIEGGLRRLPDGVQQQVSTATAKALRTAVDVATRTMRRDGGGRPANTWHKLAASLSGMAGGAFGLGGVAVELPISTTIILRSVADIARAEGEDIGELATRLACVEVFAFGSRSSTDDAAETGYFATRAALARTLGEAARQLAQKGVSKKAAPVIVQWIAKIASRYSPAVAQKIAAQAVPIAGALGGAAVNLAFIHHFQNIARGHFTVRRLERRYGQDLVRAEYERLRLMQSGVPVEQKGGPDEHFA